MVKILVIIILAIVIASSFLSIQFFNYKEYSSEIGTSVYEEQNKEDFSFMVYGDTQKRSDLSEIAHRKSVEIIKREHPDFAVLVGDLVEYGGSEQEWELFNEINSKIGDIPFYSAIGNHEYTGDPGLINYKKNIGEEEYYSFDYKGSHFVILNSNAYSGVTMTGDKEKLRKEQLDWFKKDLENNKDAKNIFVFMHHSFYASGCGNDYGTLRNDLIPLFEKYGVSIVFGGHVSMYDRSFVDGVTYITTGGAGSSICNTPKCNDWSQAKSFNYNVVRVDVSADKIATRSFIINILETNSKEESEFDLNIINKKDLQKGDQKIAPICTSQNNLITGGAIFGFS